MKQRSVLSWILIAVLFSGVLYTALAGVLHGNTADVPAAQHLSILESVFEQLSEEEKDEITPSWRAGTVEKIVLEKDSGFEAEEAYFGQSVYLVTFPSRRSEILGDVRKLADPATNRIIGFSYRR